MIEKANVFVLLANDKRTTRAEFDCCGFPEDGTRRALSLPRLKAEANEALRMLRGNCAVCERYGITCGAKGRRAGGCTEDVLDG
jgi:hypothetical protein